MILPPTDASDGHVIGKLCTVIICRTLTLTSPTTMLARRIKQTSNGRLLPHKGFTKVSHTRTGTHWPLTDRRHHRKQQPQCRHIAP